MKWRSAGIREPTDPAGAPSNSAATRVALTPAWQVSFVNPPAGQVELGRAVATWKVCGLLPCDF